MSDARLRNIDRRTVVKSGAGAAMSAFLLVACAEDAPAPAPAAPTPTTPEVPAGPTMDPQLRIFQAPSRFTLLQAFMLVAETRGIFEEEGIRVSLQPGTGTADAVTQLAAGRAFVGIADPLTIAPFRADQGVGLKSIAEIAPEVFWEVASLPETPLRNPADWQGKTIGIASPGGATEQYLDASARALGLDPANVTKVITGLDAGAYAFLERGEVDGFIAFYSSKAAIQNQGIELEYANLGTFVPVPSSSFMTDERQLQDDASREALRRWLRATRRAFRIAWDDANLDETLDSLALYSPAAVANRELAKVTWEVTRTYMSTRDEGTFFMDEDRWDAAHELIFDLGFVQNTALPPSDFYTNEILNEL